MKKIWHALLKQPKHWRILPLAILALLSVKPAIFTWNLVCSGKYFNDRPYRAESHMYAAILSRPAAFHGFKKYNWNSAARLLMKSVVKTRDLSRLDRAKPSPSDRKRIKESFRNNLYLHRLFPGFLPEARRPENLDPLSLEFLADSMLNRLNKAAFENHLSRFSREFLLNVADYCKWKGNAQMAESLTAAAGVYRTDRTYRPYRTSRPRKPRVSYIPPGDFERNWVYLDMANKKPYAEGSFTVDVTQIGNLEAVRLMGFYTRKAKGRSPARGGLRLKRPLAIGKGYFRFSLYYLTRTGREAASFHLGGGLSEYGLPPTGDRWVRADYYIDNMSPVIQTLRPMVRMKGTGALWFSGVRLVKLEEPPPQDSRPPLELERFVPEDVP